MIKEALQFLADLKKPQLNPTVEVGKDGQAYAIRADGTLGEPVRQLAPQWTKPPFQVGTLSGMVELVKAKVDDFGVNVGLHVVDYRTVLLVALRADDHGRRHVYATATHEEGAAFKFNQYQEAEEFLISFRRSFLFNDEAVKVQKLCGSLSSGTAVNVADDGVSQSVEIKSGTVSNAQVPIPAEGIQLIPWRTFRDATPVAQRFLLRLKSRKDDLPQIALYEIDQLWRLECARSVASYLCKHVIDLPVIV